MDKVEIRDRKIMLGQAGGNASKDSINYRLTLPSKWMTELNITQDDRDVKISFDGEVIKIYRETR